MEQKIQNLLIVCMYGKTGKQPGYASKCEQCHADIWVNSATEELGRIKIAEFSKIPGNEGIIIKITHGCIKCGTPVMLKNEDITKIPTRKEMAVAEESLRQKRYPGIITLEKLSQIKVGDVVERMIGGFVPVYLQVSDIKSEVFPKSGLKEVIVLKHWGKDIKSLPKEVIQEAYWDFDKSTGLEIDDEISGLVSCISRILTEEQKQFLKENKTLPK